MTIGFANGFRVVSIYSLPVFQFADNLFRFFVSNFPQFFCSFGFSLMYGSCLEVFCFAHPNMEVCPSTQRKIQFQMPKWISFVQHGSKVVEFLRVSPFSLTPSTRFEAIQQFSSFFRSVNTLPPIPLLAQPMPEFLCNLWLLLAPISVHLLWFAAELRWKGAISDKARRKR